MSTTQSILDLIDQCQFSDEDPFEINQNLFPNLKEHLSIGLIKQLEAECYANWLNWAFEGESRVSVFYKYIQESIDNNTVPYFSHMSVDTKQQIHDYFDEIVNEEREHRLIFKKIIEKTNLAKRKNYRPDFFDPDSAEFKQYEHSRYAHVEMLFPLALAVIGESYLLSCFLLFYKQSSNPVKKQLFKHFLTEESQHIAHFLNLIKSGIYSDQAKDRLHHSFLQSIQDRLNFEKAAVNVIFSRLQQGSDNKLLHDQHLFNTVAYSGKLHESFNKLVLRRSYQFYHAVFPDVTEDTFLHLVENYHSDVLIGSE